MRRAAVLFSSMLFLYSLTAMAQESGRIAVGIQGTGFFTKDSTGGTIRQTTSESGGFLLDFRYNLTRWLSADVAYGRNRVTDRFFDPTLSRIQSNAHQTMAGLVMNLPFWPKLRPYLLAEGGALVFNPTSTPFSAIPGAQTQAEAAFAYGGGVDIPVVKYLALRAEYRGLVYNSPNFNIPALDDHALTHTAEPSVGVVLRF